MPGPDQTSDELPSIDPAVRSRLLQPPRDRISVVIDTDAANEIDDQFAIAWALLSPDAVDVKAVVAEPFSFAHHRAPLLAAQARRASAAAHPGAVPEVLLEDYDAWAERLIDPGIVRSVLAPTPRLAGDLCWDRDGGPDRPVMREATAVDRDGIFRDLFTKLANGGH